MDLQNVSAVKLTDKQMDKIINYVKYSRHKLKYLLNNVQKDHIQGSNKNLQKSYFFDTEREKISELFIDICSSYNRRYINKESLVLIKEFPRNIGMFVQSNKMKHPSHTACLVIGIKKIIGQPNFNFEEANLLTFYPR